MGYIKGRQRAWSWVVILALSELTTGFYAHTEDNAPPRAPEHLRVFSRQLRVDLVWNENSRVTYEVQRAPNADGPFENLANEYPNRSFKSDFLGLAGGKYFYRVRSVGALKNNAGKVTALTSAWSQSQSASPTKEDSDALLTEVQEAAFRYFYDYAHPVSGLARESFLRNPDVCAMGATGMGLFNLIVGVERGFVSRAEAATRAERLLEFLSTKAVRFHGAFPHWVNGSTGAVIPFSEFDDGADLVETSFLIQGVLLLREFFFSQEDATESHIRQLANNLWRDVEWDWFAREEGTASFLLWHWSPNYGFKSNLRITGFNEAQSAYLLALASPTHPIHPTCYRCGWQAFRSDKQQFEPLGETPADLANPPSMFFTHYSYLGFDPHSISLGKSNYFEQFQGLCRAQIKYVENKPDMYSDYGGLWGITASNGPDGYKAFAPGPDDNGTLAPTAALSSMPYVPEQSRQALVEMYRKHGKRLWGPFGFYDAFNLKRNWVSNDFLGIDVGPIGPMIENYRTGLCWRVFSNAPEIRPMLKLLSDKQF